MRGQVGVPTTSFCAFLRYRAVVRWTPETIRDRREALGWTQQQLADALGVSLRSVTAWERGEATPRRLSDLNRVLGPAQPGSTAPPLDKASDAELVAELARRLAARHDHTAAVSGALGPRRETPPPEIWADPSLGADRAAQPAPHQPAPERAAEQC